MKLWEHEDLGNSTLGTLNQLVIGAPIVQVHLLTRMVTAGHPSLVQNSGGRNLHLERLVPYIQGTVNLLEAQNAHIMMVTVTGVKPREPSHTTDLPKQEPNSMRRSFGMV
jgi:hypothetical protein